MPLPNPSFWLSSSMLESDETKKTVGGIAEQLIREPIELTRMMKDQYYFSRRDPRRPQEEAETEEWLKKLYSSVLGEENITQTQRGFYETGEPKMVTTVKRPETTAGNIARDVGAFATSFVGLGKVTKPLKGMELLKKSEKAAPKTTKAVTGLLRGEAAVQLSLDPYRENFANIIGEWIADDNEGTLGTIETYLLDPIKSSQEKTQLENRLSLMVDGIAFTAGAYALLGTGKVTAASIRDSKTIEKNKEQFLNVLKGLRNQSKEVREAFVNQIKSKVRTKPSAIKVTEEAGADPSALQPGKISKFFSNINLQFSENPLVRRLESFRLRTFTSRGNMTPEMHERFLRTENLKGAWDQKIEFTTRALDDELTSLIKVIKKSGDSSDDVFETVNNILESKNFDQDLLNANLPETLQNSLIRARELQDEVSILWLESDLLPKEAKDKWAEALGSYFKQAYKAYDDSTFKVDKVAKEKLIQYYIKNDFNKLKPENARAQAEAKVNSILNISKNEKSLVRQSATELDKLNRKEFIAREQLPQELIDVLQPFDDPVSIIINSIRKSSHHLENLKFYKKEFQEGKNVYFFTNSTRQFDKQIPEGFGELSGKFTTKQMHDYLVGMDAISDSAIFNNALMKGMLNIKYWAQKNATVYSLLTHAKNFLGMNHFSLINAVNPYKRIKTVHNALKTQFAKSNQSQQEFMLKLRRYGLIGKNTLTGDLKGLSDDLGKLNALNIDRALSKVGTKNYNLKTADTWITKVYQSVDDYGKINMWLAEIEHLKKVQAALPKGSKFDKYRLTEQQIEEQAAKLVRSNMPNYDMIPQNIKKLRRIPFIGAFYSFSAESLRNTVNALRTIPREFRTAADLAADGATAAAKQHSIRGMQRLTGFSAGALAVDGLREYYAYRDNITESEQKAVNEYVAPFYRDTILSRNDDGDLVAFNGGSWDALNYPKITVKFAANLMDGIEDDESLVVDYLIPYFEDMGTSFVGPSITQKVINQYFFSDGKDRKGTLMRDPYNPDIRYNVYENKIEQLIDTQNLEILAKNLTKLVTPPDIRRGITYYQTKDLDQNDFGQKVNPFDRLIYGASYTTLNKEYVQNQFEFETREILNKKSLRKKELWEAVGQLTTLDIIKRNYKEANIKYYRDYSEYIKKFEAAKILGINTNVVLDQSNFSLLDKNSLPFVGTQTIKFIPLNFSLDFQNKTPSAVLSRYYDIDKMPNVNLNELPSMIFDIDKQFSKLVVLRHPDDKEKYPTVEEITKQRTSKVTGGLIKGEDVPYTKEHPEDRINPFTGEPYTALYYNTLQRQPLKDGGLLEKAGQAVKSLYDSTRSLGSMSSPKDILRVIESRRKYLSDELYTTTDEKSNKLMEASRDEWNKYKNTQKLMETELDELDKYYSQILSKSPQNQIEKVKDFIWSGTQQLLTSKLSRIPYLGPTINQGGRIIEGELADIEIAESYKGETPLLPSIYEPKLLEERALDLGEYGEYNKFIRNIQAGQEKGEALQLLKAATGPKSKFPLSKSELEDMGLYDLVSRKPSLKEIGETFSGPATTREELLSIAEARTPKLKQQEYYPQSSEGRFMSSVEAIDPLDGTTDYSIMETDDILYELNNAITSDDWNPSEKDIKSYYGKDIAFLQSAETYGYSGPDGLGDLFLQGYVDGIDIRDINDEMTDWDRINREVEQLSETELEKLFNDTTKNITPDKLSNLAENIARLRFYTDPNVHIRPDLATWEVDDVDMEWLDGISIYGNEEMGWSLIDKFNPYGKIGVVRDEPLYGDAEAAQFALQDYIRNVGVIGEERVDGMVMPSQGLNMGTLPDPQEYVEFMVKETDEEDTYQTKGYTQNPQHWSSEYEAENAIGWAQLSTRNLADGSQSQHAEAIQSDLHQAANSPDSHGLRTGYKSDRERDTKAVIEHLEKVLKDFEITSNPIEQFADTLGTHRFMFKNIKGTETMKDLVKDIIVDESLEGDMRQANIDASFGQLKRYLFKPVNEASIIQEDQEIFGNRVDWWGVGGHMFENIIPEKRDEMIKSYKETRKGYSEENLKKLARSAIIRETAEVILSAPKTKWVSDEYDLYDKDAHIPVNNRYYYDINEAAIPDIPMKDGEWRKSIWKRSINRGIQNGKTKFSWSPAWIQEVHWGADEATIHEVADQDLARLSKKLAKEYGGEFKTEQLIITEAEIKSGKGGINISRLKREIANDPKKGDFIIEEYGGDGKWFHANIKANNVEEIRINVPVLDLTGKAAGKWKRLGYAMAKGGPVTGRDKLGRTQLSALTDEEFNYLLGIATSKENEPRERQSAWKELTKGMGVSVKGISKGISSLLSNDQGLTQEQINFLRTLKK